MNYRSLGRTRLKINPLCLGTRNFGYRTDENISTRIIHQAFDMGVNFIDTANLYGQPARDGKRQGLTEEILGRTLKGKRDQIVLATKFHASMDRDDPNARGAAVVTSSRLARIP